MLLDLAKSLSFLLSLLSLYPLLFSAFFVPGTQWEDRLLLSLSRVAMSAACCLLSGLLFQRSGEAGPSDSIVTTLPMRIFFFALGMMAFLFAASWYLETYYMPLLWKNLPYKF